MGKVIERDGMVFETDLEPITYFEQKAGNEVAGTYEGFYISTKGKYGPQVVFKIRTATGLVGLNGNGNLTGLMSQYATNSGLLIQYQGKQIARGGFRKGQESHTWNIVPAKGVETLDKSARTDFKALLSAARTNATAVDYGSKFTQIA